MQKDADRMRDFLSIRRSVPMRYRELQEKAVNFAKIGGDVDKAQVYAILALAESIRDIPDNDVAMPIALGLERIAVSIQDAS